MVMPLWDHSPFRWPTPPYVMWSLIAINFGIFFWLAGLAPGDAEGVARTAGLVPAALFGGGRPSPGRPPGAADADHLPLPAWQFHARFRQHDLLVRVRR